MEKLIKTEEGDASYVANVHNLACAMLQLLQAVDSRYLKKPLGGKSC